MKEDRLSLIGARIKDLRTERKMTLRELARRSNLSAGLISKIENFRTMPSIAVLIDIANSLQVDISELVKNINAEEKLPYMLVRKEEEQPELREDSPGLIYNFLLEQHIGVNSLRVNRVIVPAGVYRKPVSTHANEVIYVLQGEAEYTFGTEKCTIGEGDTLYFDGRVPHAVLNRGSIDAILFKVYLIGFGE